jgi:hypothetical protein
VSDTSSQIERRGAWLAVLLAGLLAMAYGARAEGPADDTAATMSVAP